MKHFTGLAHIALFTKDLKTSTAFYEALGGVVTDHADVEKPTGTNHIAIEVDDIDAAFADVKAAGVSSFRTEEPMTMPIFGGIRNLFFKGPDGELIELLQHL